MRLGLLHVEQELLGDRVAQRVRSSERLVIRCGRVADEDPFASRAGAFSDRLPLAFCGQSLHTGPAERHKRRTTDRSSRETSAINKMEQKLTPCGGEMECPLDRKGMISASGSCTLSDNPCICGGDTRDGGESVWSVLPRVLGARTANDSFDPPFLTSFTMTVLSDRSRQTGHRSSVSMIANRSLKPIFGVIRDNRLFPLIAPLETFL